MAGGSRPPLPRVVASALGLIAVAAFLTVAAHVAAGQRDPQYRLSPLVSATPAVTATSGHTTHQLPGVWPVNIPGTAGLAAPLLVWAVASLVNTLRPVRRPAGHHDRAPPVALSTL